VGEAERALNAPPRRDDRARCDPTGGSRLFQQVTDFLEESEALYSLLEPLADADFARVTQFKGYTIGDVIGHLHHWNHAADLSLLAPEAFQAFFAEIARGLGQGRTLVEIADAWLKGLRGRALLREWRRFYREMAAHFGEADPKARVKWAGPDMSVRSSITARLMETWAHGQEVYDVLGVERVNTDRIRNVAQIGVSTFGWTFVNRRLEVPRDVPYVRLTAPSGALWEWNEPSDKSRVEGSATEFCQVVTQVRNVADTKLQVTGDTARRWMSIAQCFAGGANDPPPPGTRFRQAAAS
jgi:uncharacterized protein (TIGR03084 family)